MGWHKKLGACPVCSVRIHTQSKHCALHKKSGREPESYTCSADCQKIHVRCRMCGVLTSGEHGRLSIDHLCFDPVFPKFSCAAKRYAIYNVVCVMCSREYTYAISPPQRCVRCSGLIAITEVVCPPAKAV